MVAHMNPHNVLKEILSKQQPFEGPFQVPELQSQLVEILGRILKGTISPSDIEMLNEILSTTYQYFSREGCDYETSLICRTLYTDIAITMSCCHLLQDPSNSIEDHFQSIPSLLSAIQGLDRAIVFAGAPDKLDLVHELIGTIQCQYHMPKSAISGCLLESVTSGRKQYGPTSTPVPQFRLQNLFSSDLSTPFVIPGAILDWPAISDPDHAWNSIDYLLSVAGPGRIVPVEIGNDYRVDNWSQKLMPWEDFLCWLRTSDGARNETFYLAQHSLFNQFPKLNGDILIPDLVYLGPQTTEAGYKPPTNEEGLIMNAWLGPEGTISPAHKVRFHLFPSSDVQQLCSRQDPYFNCYGKSIAPDREYQQLIVGSSSCRH
jgi:hypothetical protein